MNDRLQSSAVPAERELGASVALPRTVLREHVKDLLLQRIVDGVYPPGSRLVETRIAREFGVSQAPVREALRDLEQLGCVVHEPFRGCSVREFSIPELLDAFPVRIALEELAARLAAERITDEQLDGLAEEIERMREAAARGDDKEESVADVRFHATIVAVAGNMTLERQWSQLQPYARTFLSLRLPHQDLKAASERHVPILEALRTRDPDLAAMAVREHLDEAADQLRVAEAESRKEAP